MSTGKITGSDCKLYRSSSLLSAMVGADDATWIEITNVVDITVPDEFAKADMTTRGDARDKGMPTKRSGDIDIKMMWDTTETSFAAIWAAFKAKTKIALAVMDGDIDVAGSAGLAANFYVMKCSRGEPLRDAVTADITISPFDFDEDYVSAGS